MLRSLCGLEFRVQKFEVVPSYNSLAFFSPSTLDKSREMLLSSLERRMAGLISSSAKSLSQHSLSASLYRTWRLFSNSTGYLPWQEINCFLRIFNLHCNCNGRSEQSLLMLPAKVINFIFITLTFRQLVCSHDDLLFLILLILLSSQGDAAAYIHNVSSLRGQLLEHHGGAVLRVRSFQNLALRVPLQKLMFHSLTGSFLGVQARNEDVACFSS